MDNNGAFRKKRIFFSQVSNEALRDASLSLKSKGLYALIQSYITIENFILYKNTLKQNCKEGEKAFEASWKELKDRGYLIQYKLRNEKGSFYYEYDLLDETNYPKKEGVDLGSVEKGGTGKGGLYNNTDFTNTDFKEDEEETIFITYTKSKGKKITSPEKDKLKILMTKHSKDLILKAIDIMVTDAEKITLKYIASTLEDWKTKDIQTVEEVDKMRAEWQESKNKKQVKKPAVKSKKVSTFNDYKQREYNFNDLEKKLVDEEEVLKEADCSKCILWRNGKCFLNKSLVSGKCSNYSEKKIC